MQKLRFILVGGYLSKASDGGANLYQELVAPYGKNPKVLICAFAREKSEWQFLLAQEEKQFGIYVPEVSPQIVLSSLENFKQEVKSTDVLFFRGGNTEVLINNLQKTGNWYSYLAGKTIAGSSAGAYILADKYVELGRLPKIRSGLGLVDVLAIAHYRSDSFPLEIDSNNLSEYWDEVDRIVDLSGYRKVIHLREGEYITIKSP